jgi:probable FeS assembly SUF system protein SufT
VRTYENEPFVIQRDVEAIMVPSGHAITLKAGLAGYITQALGGSFTLYVEGNLYRLPGESADAIGKEVSKTPELPPNATASDVRDLAWTQLRGCYDPEIPINVVDLGLVYDCDVQDNADGTRSVQVQMTLTAPGCGMGDVLREDIQGKLLAVPGISEADVQVVFDPPWSLQMMSDAAKLQLGMM